jgi:hypothetical protein
MPNTVKIKGGEMKNEWREGQFRAFGRLTDSTFATHPYPSVSTVSSWFV